MTTFRGNKIIAKSKEKYVYADTKEPVPLSWETKPCGICKKTFTPEGHDPCLGTLPGVMNACCGHGIVEDAYIQYSVDNILQGQDAIKEFKILKEMKLEILDLAVVMTESIYTKKNVFRYMLRIQHKNEMPYYIHIGKSDVKSMFNKFKFSHHILYDHNLRYRVYKPVPWSFCETPEEKCTMNYCDENGCQNRHRNFVEGMEPNEGINSTTK